MPWCTMSARVRLRSAASRLLVAIVWVSGIYAASTAGIFFLNLHVAVLCESPGCLPETQMGVYKSERSCIWQLQGVLAQASCILGFVYFDVL